MKVRTEMGHFWITFENGYTLSVFNGYGSHTENHFNLKKWQDITENRLIYEGWDSEFVEIAVLSPDEDVIVTKEVLGYEYDVQTVDVNTLVDIINTVNEYEIDNS